MSRDRPAWWAIEAAARMISPTVYDGMGQIDAAATLWNFAEAIEDVGRQRYGCAEPGCAVTGLEDDDAVFDSDGRRLCFQHLPNG